MAGVTAVASVAFIGATSFTSFNPSDWLRVVGMLAFPVALVAAVAFGWSGWHNGARNASAAGLGIAAAVLVAFVVMIVTGG